MNRYKIAKEARQDLKEIYRYIFSANPSAADSLHDLFFDKFHMLAQNPLLGEARNDLAENLRMFTTGNYVILYRPAKTGIEIIQIVHSARDLPALWSSSKRNPQ
jgi:toxin ParE1/3/4